ncbi:MAG: serine hydrolase domain-containing protein [Actinoallomurus sp.]
MRTVLARAVEGGEVSGLVALVHRHGQTHVVALGAQAVGGDVPTCTPDEWIKRLGALPPACRPGSAWMYHTPADVLGVLIARAAGRPLPDFLGERDFEPLGMNDTGFHVPPEKLDRIAVSHAKDPRSGALARRPEPDRAWDRPPAFPSGGGGPGLLSGGWGFGVGVDGHRDDLATRPGRFGWAGGLGTSAYTDPAEDPVGVLMPQTAMSSPLAPHVFQDFWTSAYAAIDD